MSSGEHDKRQKTATRNKTPPILMVFLHRSPSISVSTRPRVGNQLQGLLGYPLAEGGDIKGHIPHPEVVPVGLPVLYDALHASP